MYSKKEYFEIQKAILFLNKSFLNVDDTIKPELLHSLHTGFRLLDYCYPVEIVIAGFLHDTIEEGAHHEEISALFGERVYTLILVNSKDETIENWFEQTTELIASVASHSSDAMIVKAADVLDNFVYIFNTGTDFEREKKLHLAKQIFEHTDSTDGIFAELRREYEKRNKSGE